MAGHRRRQEGDVTTWKGARVACKFIEDTGIPLRYCSWNTMLTHFPQRNFQFTSMVGFACTLIATWEVLLTTLISILTNGGTAGVIWAFLIVFVGFLFVYLSIAEMASM
jgi:hypothetical protein